jgi:hypothetical protein
MANSFRVKHLSEAAMELAVSRETDPFLQFPATSRFRDF